MSQPLTIHIMTSSLAPGDAIGNYILTKARIWQTWGVKVRLYADFVDPEYPAWALASDLYRPTGNDILWYHYSIYADNLAIVRESPDYKVMDFHGISPPRLFHNQNPYLEMLCQKGIDLLPSFADVFDVHVVHSDYARRELVHHGYDNEQIYKLPLCVDLARFSANEVVEDDLLSQSLRQVDYLLFVGRVVPQKDILALLEIFAHIHKLRPELVLVIAGSPALSRKYEQQIQQLIQKRGIGSRVLFTGQVKNGRVLAQLF
ncbi:MAG: glycosyltransferase family 4 protein [Anaerolineales bacterium]|nr:glycosyltransferase family 4 protein [Anaerolineales bacterium]